MRRLIGVLAATALGALLATGCGEAEAWRQAELNDGADAYHEFLEKFPESEHAAQALKRIEEQDYVRAVDLGTANSFETYLQQHPEGSNSDAARTNHARLLFEEAKEETSAEKMARYVELYPDGASALEARHYQRVFEYAADIDIHDVVSRQVNLQGKEDGELDGWGIYAKVTNNGDKALTTCQIRIEWLSEADVVLLKRLWYVATPPLDMYPTAEWMQVPMKPGETRDLEYEFGRGLKPDYWEDKVRLRIHDLRFEGEKEEIEAETEIQ